MIREKFHQRTIERVFLKTNIPAVNETGWISWKNPIDQVTAEYILTFFPNSDAVARMKKNCEDDGKILVYAPFLGVFGKACERDIERLSIMQY